MTKSKRYEYSCSTCQGDVSKPPCSKENGTLGGWSCANCGPGIKVSRKIK